MGGLLARGLHPPPLLMLPLTRHRVRVPAKLTISCQIKVICLPFLSSNLIRNHEFKNHTSFYQHKVAVFNVPMHYCDWGAPSLGPLTSDFSAPNHHKDIKLFVYVPKTSKKAWKYFLGTVHIKKMKKKNKN